MPKNKFPVKNPVNNALDTYIQKIHQFPVLSDKEEYILAREIKESSQKIKLAPSSLKESDKIELINSYRQKRNHLMKSNLRLVLSVIRTLPNLDNQNKWDLIEEGNLGLLEAIDRFDYSKGFRFSTYSIWWIKHAIHQSLVKKNHIIQLPTRLNRFLKKYHKAYYKLFQTLERAPSLEELAEELNVESKKLKSILYSHIQEYSLDKELYQNDNTNTSLIDYINDSRYDPYEVFSKKSIIQDIQATLNSLPHRQSSIIRCRYGFDGKKWTLKETGYQLNLTRERIRQLQLDTIKYFRSNHKFKDLIENY